MEFLSADYRRIARDKLRGNWGIALATSLVFTLLGGFASSVGGSSMSAVTGSSVIMSQRFDFDPAILAPGFGLLGLVIVVLSLAGMGVVSALMLGHNLFYIDLCNNSDADLGTLFKRFSLFFKALGLVLFMALFTFLWSLLLFVPGIIAGYRYTMAPYLMAQNPQMGIREAMNESKRLMRGHKWRLFCLHLSFIGWGILCLFTLGIGYLWLIPYMQAAEAAFYLDRTGQGIPLNPPGARGDGSHASEPESIA